MYHFYSLKHKHRLRMVVPVEEAEPGQPCRSWPLIHAIWAGDVLPRGSVKVRYYRIWSNSCRAELQQARTLLDRPPSAGTDQSDPAQPPDPPPAPPTSRPLSPLPDRSPHLHPSPPSPTEDSSTRHVAAIQSRTSPTPTAASSARLRSRLRPKADTGDRLPICPPAAILRSEK